MNTNQPIRNSYTVDHPEASYALMLGTAGTGMPIVADLIGASTSFGVFGCATAVAGAGTIALGVSVREAPTATALCGAAATAWGSYMAVSGFVPSFAPLHQLAIGACMTFVSWAAGRAVEWKRAGTPIERTRLEMERVKLAGAVAGAGPATVAASWSPLPSSSWSPPSTVAGTTDPIRIGPDVTIPLTGGHIMIAGRTGAGKSVVLACLIADLLPRKNLRITVVDPKGDVVLQTMRGTGVVLVDANGAEDVLTERVVTMERRGVLRGDLSEQYMVDGGDAPGDVWEPTADEPWDVVIVDEFTDFAGTPVMDMVDTAARKGRANGLTLVMCTQSVGADLFRTKKSNTGGGLRSQFASLVALGLATPAEADKVFGQGAAAAGWAAHELPDEPGHLLVKSPTSRLPVVRRAPNISIATFADVVRRNAGRSVGQGPLRKALNAPVTAVRTSVDEEPVVFAPAPVAVVEPPSETAVPATVRDRISAYLSEHGTGRAAEMAPVIGDTRETVKAELHRMRKAGLVEGDGAGKHWLPAAREDNVIPFARRR